MGNRCNLGIILEFSAMSSTSGVGMPLQQGLRIEEIDLQHIDGVLSTLQQILGCQEGIGGTDTEVARKTRMRVEVDEIEKVCSQHHTGTKQQYNHGKTTDRSHMDELQHAMSLTVKCKFSN